MLDLMQHDSDGDLGSGPFNSSSQTSSMSSSASGFGRCSSTSRSSSSFDGAGGLSSCASPAARRRPPTPAALSSKPHQRSSPDPSWAAIRRRAAPLGPKDFNLLRRIGSGDIGTVYLCRLRDTDADDERKGNATSSSNPLLYAMKVVDKRELERKKKLGRAEAERRVLRSLDHPFLPTLYADFDAGEHYSCVVMEFCPAGDLHSLRHRLPSSRFPLPAARFYAAEVLVALEYLHMLGVVYRDLKPENVLIRPDGHIMLSDFDLSFESTASPTLDVDDDPPFLSTPSCLPTPRLFSSTTKSTTPKRSGGILRRCRSATAALGRRAFVAEPVEARSLSFVGTHEYVAPEVATGREHGSAVDWWAFGVFLYELLHGRTPFVGTTNESTLRNIVKQPLSFPAFSGGGGVDSKARDLIARLLNKDPGRRLGSRRGAADVKEHPFFAGLNFALLRSHRPPVVPGGPVGRPKAKEPGRFEHF